MENHIVVFGWDYFIKSIVEQLVAARQQVLIISNRREHEDILNDFSEENRPSLFISSYYDYERLEQAMIPNSRIILVNLLDDTKNLVFVLKLKRRYPNVRIIVPLNKPELRDTFVKAGITYSLSRTEICAKLFASHLFEKHVAEYLDDVLTSSGEGENDYDMQQYRMTGNCPVIGMRYQDVFVLMKKKFNAILIGISKPDELGDHTLHKNPYTNFCIDSGDYLALITNAVSAPHISDYFGVQEGA